MGRVKGDLTLIDKGYARVSGDEVVLRGKFRHQGHRAHYAVCAAKDRVSLFALPIVIQAACYGDLGRPSVIVDIEVGDYLEVDGEVYEVLDDRWGYDPRLVPVAPEGG